MPESVAPWPIGAAVSPTVRMCAHCYVQGPIVLWLVLWAASATGCIRICSIWFKGEFRFWLCELFAGDNFHWRQAWIMAAELLWVGGVFVWLAC